MRKYDQFVWQMTWVGFFLVVAFAIRTFYQAIPEQIYITAGETVSYDFDVPVSIVLKEESAEVFESLTDPIMRSTRPAYTVTCKLFGLFPVKDVEVMLVDRQQVYASGMPIGIYVKTEGILVLGTAKVSDGNGRERQPAQNLVKSGDYIVSLNGEPVYEKEDLIEKIDAYGENREILGLRRNDEYIEVSLMPVETSQGRHLLGIWVRDDLAGVGTLTYYQEDGNFGALGHAVSDGDTGTRMDLSEGWIYEADIIGIKKGENGTPGELSGMIDYSPDYCLGSITENTPLGIRGILQQDSAMRVGGKVYGVCYKQDIRIGTAYILSEVSGELRSYEIEIESLDFSGHEENKGILFRVTDPDLLGLTGGIVQGMSGSPIIQDERIIGAVTHVFVSDASMGYGIFIEKMLNE